MTSAFSPDFRLPGDPSAGLDPSSLTQDQRDASEALAGDGNRQLEDAISALRRRIGCTLRYDGAQGVGSPGAIYPTGWPIVEFDSNGKFYPADTGYVVIPPGLGGVYVITYAATADTDPDAGFHSGMGFVIDGGTTQYKGNVDNHNNFAGTCTAVRLLDEGQSVSCYWANDSGAFYGVVASRLEMYLLNA